MNYLTDCHDDGEDYGSKFWYCSKDKELPGSRTDGRQKAIDNKRRVLRKRDAIFGNLATQHMEMAEIKLPWWQKLVNRKNLLAGWVMLM